MTRPSLEHRRARTEVPASPSARRSASLFHGGRRPAPIQRSARAAQRRRDVIAYGLLLPSAVVLIGFLGAPFLSIFYYALHDTAIDGSALYVGLRHLEYLRGESRFVQNVWATVQYLLGVLALSTPLAYLAAVLVSSAGRARGVLRTTFLLPWILAPVVTALLFKTMLDPATGPVTRISAALFGSPVYLTLSEAGSMLVVVAHAAWRSFPLQMLMIAAGMAAIPQELYEAVRVDGGGRWAEFRHVTLPLTRAPLLAAVIIISIFTIQDVEGIYALTQGGPGYATEVLAMRLFKEAFVYFDTGIGSAVGVVVIVLTVAVIGLYLKLLGRGEEAA